MIIKDEFVVGVSQTYNDFSARVVLKTQHEYYLF